MATKYRVIGKTDTPPKPKHLLGVYDVPDEALRLSEDVLLIELILDLLGKLDPNTINDKANESGTTIRRVNFILNAVRNQARDKLRYKWLGGRAIIPRERPQTMADIWALMKDSLERCDNLSVDR